MRRQNASSNSQLPKIPKPIHGAMRGRKAEATKAKLFEQITEEIKKQINEVLGKIKKIQWYLGSQMVLYATISFASRNIWPNFVFVC